MEGVGVGVTDEYEYMGYGREVVAAKTVEDGVLPPRGGTEMR